MELLRSTGNSFRQLEECFLVGDPEKMERLEFRFHRLFRQISMAIDEMADLKKELRVRHESGGLSYPAVVWLARIIDKLAAVAHHSWDIVSLSPDILCVRLMPAVQKDALDRNISSIAEMLREITSACEGNMASTLDFHTRGSADAAQPPAIPASRGMTICG